MRKYIDELEQELRARLEGCRLVYEVGFDEDLRLRLVRAMTKLRDFGTAENVRLLELRYPAVTTAYLVGEGIFRYKSGNFWGNLEVTDLAPRFLGPAFEKSIRRLQLEDFEQLVQEGALRFLAPILAHGGIPVHSLGDFFRVLSDELHRGGYDAANVLGRLRASPSRFAAADKPVERFLLHGGMVSADLLERCIDLVRECPTGTEEIDPERFGLPKYLCDAYATFDAHIRRTTAERLRETVPRPKVIIDPYGATGPLLHLPAMTGDFVGSHWVVTSHEGATRYSGSSEDRFVPLPPARTWTATLEPRKAERGRVFPFTGLGGGGILLFDDTGRLVSDAGRLRHAHVWVLHPADCTLTAATGTGDATSLPRLEVAPALAGSWAGYGLVSIDMSDVRRLFASGAGGAGSTETIWVHIRQAEVALVGEPLQGVLEAENGLPVYASCPRLQSGVDVPRDLTSRWRIALTFNGKPIDASQLLHDQHITLESLIGADSMGEVTLLVRGPLGSDLRARFLVVPGLTIERPVQLLAPGAAPGRIVIRTAKQVPAVKVVPEGTECSDVYTRRRRSTLDHDPHLRSMPPMVGDLGQLRSWRSGSRAFARSGTGDPGPDDRTAGRSYTRLGTSDFAPTLRWT